jgi:Prohead core protein serine protease
MKLITEVNERIQVITEGKGENRKHFIEGVFLQAEMKNRNGRVYPIDILENEVDRYNQAFVKQNRAFGELGHPDGPSINLERVSHMIKDLYREGNNFIGKAKIMDTPYGKIVKNLIDEGAKLGVSSRGLGTLQEVNGVSTVNGDFKLSTAADIVADPSAPDAFVRGIMESREWIYESGVLKAVEVENYKRQIKSASSRKLEEAKLQAFKDFLNKL